MGPCINCKARGKGVSRFGWQIVTEKWFDNRVTKRVLFFFPDIVVTFLEFYWGLKIFWSLHYFYWVHSTFTEFFRLFPTFTEFFRLLKTFFYIFILYSTFSKRCMLVPSPIRQKKVQREIFYRYCKYYHRLAPLVWEIVTKNQQKKMEPWEYEESRTHCRTLNFFVTLFYNLTRIILMPICSRRI